MAANMTAMRVEATPVAGKTNKRRAIRRWRIVLVGLVMVVLVALLLAAAVLHPRRASQQAASALPRAVTTTHQLTVAPVCTGLDDSGYVPTCYTPQADGTWLVTQKDWEGTWQPMGTVTTLPPPPLGPSHP
jgi:hypothetical protein